MGTTTLSPEDVSRRMAKGAAWMVALRLGDRALGIVNTMILARLLAPQDFGLVAMATALLGVIEIMSTFSFDLALIQNQKAERRHYDTAWTLNVLCGGLTALLLAAFAAPAAHFYGDPRVEAIVYLLAGAACLQGFQNIGIVAFRKELDFRREFVLLALQRIIGVAVTLVLAFALRSYWALVVGMLTSRVASVAISYWLHAYRPRFALDGGRDLMRFSGWMLINNLVVFGATRGYDFVIGRRGGAHALGLYSVAYEISNLPTTELVFPVSRALFPGFSQLAADANRLKQTLLRVVALVALITIPSGAGIAMLAEPVVRLLLGEQWLQCVPLIQVLAVYGVVRSCHAGLGDAYLALGLPRIIALINLPHILIGWPLMFYLLGRHGIEVAAWAVLVASGIGLVTNLTIAVNVLKLRFRQLAACYVRPLVAVAIMVLVLKWITQAWPPAAQVGVLLAQTAFYVVCGAGCFGAAVLLLWRMAGRPDGAERFLLDRAFSRKGALAPGAYGAARAKS